MRKYSFALTCIMTLTTSSFAVPIDSRTALARALDDAPGKVRSLNKTQWVCTDVITREGDTMIYLFTAKDRFMAVAADTKAPALLGYSDAGSLFVNGELAPACRYWLDFMAARIASLPEKDERIKTISKFERMEMEKIEPMVMTRWNQDAPYNDLSPRIKEAQTYTGCVATAMSQVMKYHNWPTTGEGSNSYRWSSSILSLDFSGCTFVWDDMLDVYKEGEYTEAQGNAVAELMYAAGISVYMNFGTDGSGASSMSIAPALGSNFRYDKQTLRYLKREYYSLDEWENIIYTSLKEDGPVIYDGQSYQGGHSYVCDGYDGNGYFHFNWGWGGVSDGYFLLDALDPFEQGIGGSASNSGFDFMQDIIVGIRPDRDGKGGEMNGSLLASASFVIDTEKEYALNDEFTVSFPSNNFAYNVGPGTLPANLIVGLRYTPIGDGEEYYSVVMDDQEVPIGYGFSALPLIFDEEMADGEYIATLVSGMDAENLEPVPVPIYDSPGYHVSVTDGRIKFTEISPVVLEALSFSFPDELEKLEITGKKKVFTSTAQVENPSEKPVYAYISCLILNDVDYKCAEGYSIVEDFAPGETKEIVYSSPFTKTLSFKLKPGDFKYVLCQETSTAYIPFAMKNIRIVDNLSGIEELEGSDISSEEWPIDIYDLSGLYLGTIKGDPASGSMTPHQSSNLRIIKKRGTKGATIMK